MVDNFRSRMGDLRQEIDRIASQAEELEHVVQEQQVRLEEMDLLVRQRDEQLAEQQAHVEGLESALRQREEDLTALRAQLAAKEQALAAQDADLAGLRAQVAEHEAAEAALREELARARLAPAATGLSAQPVLERFAVLEGLVNRQGESLAALRTLIQEEMGRLHGRLDHLEERLAAAPAVLPAPVAEPLAPAATPAVEPVVPTAAPAVEIVPPEKEAVPLAAGEADSLQTVLQDTLDMLPEAALVGLAARDGLNVEMLVRHELAFPQPLELELADLTAEATRVAAALSAGPLLTVAFQSGNDHVLLSPVGEEHFAYLLTPADSPAEFQRAQAVLLQTVSRLNDLS